MKNTIKTLLVVIITGIQFASFAQAPGMFNYQAVIRSSNGTPLADTSIQLAYMIYNSNSQSGTRLYVENQTQYVTNAYGVVNAQIGKNPAPNYNLSTLNWNSGQFYIDIVIGGASIYGGINLPQLVSVPYALYANKSDTASYAANANTYIAGNGISISNDSIINSAPNQTVANGATNYVSKFTGTNALGNSLIYDNGSYVGIGTTNPNYILDVTGNTSAVGHFMNVTNGGTGVLGNSTSWIGVEGDGGSIGVRGQGPTGLTGDGTSTGVYGDATGSTTVYGVYGDATSGTTAYGVFGNAGGAATTNYGIYGTVSNTGSSNNWAGYFNGLTYCSNGVWTGSDRKLKNDIQPINGAMAIINRLNPSSYTFKTTEYRQMNLPEGLQYGLIADELQKVVPGAVKKVVQSAEYENHDGKNGKKLNDEVEFNAVNYTQMIPILIGAAKEQQAIIGQLQQQLAVQTQQIDELKKQNEKLFKSIGQK